MRKLMVVLCCFVLFCFFSLLSDCLCQDWRRHDCLCCVCPWAAKIWCEGWPDQLCSSVLYRSAVGTQGRYLSNCLEGVALFFLKTGKLAHCLKWYWKYRSRFCGLVWMLTCTLYHIDLMASCDCQITKRSMTTCSFNSGSPLLSLGT